MRLFILITILTFSNITFGQEVNSKVRQYYSLKNEGDDYLYFKKDTSMALIMYDSAFKYFSANFDTSYCELYQVLINLHATQKNSKKVYNYLRYGIQVYHINEKPEHYLPAAWGNREEFKYFRNSEYWNFFLKEYDSLYKSSTSTLNWELLSEYTSVSKMDQIVRVGDMTKIGQLCRDSGYSIDKITSALIGDIDKLNLLRVIELIRKNGFLKYSETGGKIGIYNNVLFHSFSSCNRDQSIIWTYYFLDSLLLSNVLVGKYPSSLYAFFKDRSYAYSCEKPQKYGNWSGGSGVIIQGLQDIENVDKLRNEIGLPPLFIQSLIDGFKLPKGYKIPEKYK